jgi:hypothetical protein
LQSVIKTKKGWSERFDELVVFVSERRVRQVAPRLPDEKRLYSWVTNQFRFMKKKEAAGTGCRQLH